MSRLVNVKPGIQSVDRLKKDYRINKQRKKNIQAIANDQIINQKLKNLNPHGSSSIHQIKAKIAASNRKPLYDIQKIQQSRTQNSLAWEKNQIKLATAHKTQTATVKGSEEKQKLGS